MLEGKTALVTGGGRGIGRATALLLAERGARVAVCSRTQSEVDGTVSQIILKGGIAKGYLCDVADEARVVELFSRIRGDFGRLDILVNNAGMFAGGMVENTSLSEFNETVAANLTSVFLCGREAFGMMKKNGGSIVNVSSLAGVKGAKKFPGFGAYSAAKSGVVGLTEVMAEEGRGYGIRANAVCPGAVDTAMLRAAFPDADFPKLRPEQVAAAILFLAGPESSAVNGTCLELPSDLLKG